MSLNKENVRKLVEALRSGKYKQTTNYLTKIANGEQSHCCLGVACLVAKENGVFVDVQVVGDDAWQTVKYNGDGLLLPGGVVQWYGFTSTTPDIKAPNGAVSPATIANDDLGWDFNQIADGFERMYLTDDSE